MGTYIRKKHTRKLSILIIRASYAMHGMHYSSSWNSGDAHGGVFLGSSTRLAICDLMVVLYH